MGNVQNCDSYINIYLDLNHTRDRIMFSEKHVAQSFGKGSTQDYYHRSEGRNPAFRKERKRKAEMTFVWACNNRPQARLEGKAWRIGSQAAIPRVSRGRILCRGRMELYWPAVPLISSYSRCFAFNSTALLRHPIQFERKKRVLD
jgi:hypothetical protein